jgi:hypothetical protein
MKVPPQLFTANANSDQPHIETSRPACTTREAEAPHVHTFVQTTTLSTPLIFRPLNNIPQHPRSPPQHTHY